MPISSGVLLRGVGGDGEKRNLNFCRRHQSTQDKIDEIGFVM
jgi:hypothetical protein